MIERMIERGLYQTVLPPSSRFSLVMASRLGFSLLRKAANAGGAEYQHGATVGQKECKMQCNGVASWSTV